MSGTGASSPAASPRNARAGSGAGACGTPAASASAFASISSPEHLAMVEEQFRLRLVRASLKTHRAILDNAQDVLQLERAKSVCDDCGRWLGDAAAGGATVCATCPDAPAQCLACALASHIDVRVWDAAHEAEAVRTSAIAGCLDNVQHHLVSCGTSDPSAIAAMRRRFRGRAAAAAVLTPYRDSSWAKTSGNNEVVERFVIISAVEGAEAEERACVVERWVNERFSMCGGHAAVDRLAALELVTFEALQRTSVLEEEGVARKDTHLFPEFRVVVAAQTAASAVASAAAAAAATDLMARYETLAATEQQRWSEAVEAAFATTIEPFWCGPLTSFSSSSTSSASQRDPLVRAAWNEGVCRRSVKEVEAAELAILLRPIIIHQHATELRRVGSTLLDAHCVAREEVWAAALSSIAALLAWRYEQIHQRRLNAALLQHLQWSVAHDPHEGWRRGQLEECEETARIVLVYASSLAAMQVMEHERRAAQCARFWAHRLSRLLPAVEASARTVMLQQEQRSRSSIALTFRRQTRFDAATLHNILPLLASAVEAPAVMTIRGKEREQVELLSAVVEPLEGEPLPAGSLFWISEPMWRLDRAAKRAGGRRTPTSAATATGAEMVVAASSARSGRHAGTLKVRTAGARSSPPASRGIQPGWGLAVEAGFDTQLESPRGLEATLRPGMARDASPESSPLQGPSLRPTSFAQSATDERVSSFSNLSTTRSTARSTPLEEWVAMEAPPPPCALSILSSLTAPQLRFNGLVPTALLLLEEARVWAQQRGEGQKLIAAHSEADLFRNMFAQYESLVHTTTAQFKAKMLLAAERERLLAMETGKQPRGQQQQRRAMPERLRAAVRTKQVRPHSATAPADGNRAHRPTLDQHPLLPSSDVSFFSPAFLFEENHPSLRVHTLDESPDGPGHVTRAMRIRQRPNTALAVHAQHQAVFPAIEPSATAHATGTEHEHVPEVPLRETSDAGVDVDKLGREGLRCGHGERSATIFLTDPQCKASVSEARELTTDAAERSLYRAGSRQLRGSTLEQLGHGDHADGAAVQRAWSPSRDLAHRTTVQVFSVRNLLALQHGGRHPIGRCSKRVASAKPAGDSNTDVFKRLYGRKEIMRH